MVKILIGMPVFKRAWILPLWFQAIKNQTFPLSDLGFIFELAPDDQETHDVLFSFQQAHPEVSIFDINIDYDSEHTLHPPKGRHWSPRKYDKMVKLRNSLLERVCCHQPERYLSLDSDLILENPATLQYLYELTEFMDIVSPLSYMKWDDYGYPSVMTWVNKPGERARRIHDRYRIGEVFEADIVMAAVMMRPEVYERTRYQYHPQGEDLGFATQYANNGFSAYCVSNHYAAHIMHEHILPIYLTRGDYRTTNVRDSIIAV